MLTKHTWQYKIGCFCASRLFHENVAPCIAEACGDKDQVQTEQYAQRICSIAGIELPSFKELLENQKIKASPTVNADASSLLSSTNHTLLVSNGTGSTTIVSAHASVKATATGSTVTSAAESKRIDLKVYAAIASLVGIGVGIGMFLM